jgi:lysophospholipase L1-like esterase
MTHRLDSPQIPGEKNMKNLASAALVALLFTTAAQAASTQWVGTWGASPLPAGPAGGPAPPPVSLDNQTVRQVVRISAGGDRVRLRLTNEYGAKPLRVGAATVSLLDAQGQVVAGSQRPVRFAGQTGTIIPAASPLVSDAVDLEVPALSRLAISLYFPENTGPCTCHAVGAQEAQVSDTGDHTTEATFVAKQTLQSRLFLSGVEVETRAGRAKVIAVLGDSISDGVGSTPGTNRRWPDLLADRLNKGKGGTGWGIVNEGISGNRVLDDGAGQSALARFDRDVLATPGLTHVIVFEGVNDLGISWGAPAGPQGERFRALQPPVKATAERIIDGYRQLIARAHAHGLKIYGATIAPYEGAAYWSAEGEAHRARINQWIRTSREFDGVLDFDAVLRDPAKPTQMSQGKHAGDHLHGSDAGYADVANSIDLKLFR